MSENWVQRCERALGELKTLEAKKGKDRLELVNSMRFGLGALWNSIAGWMQWINNPAVTTMFNPKELEDMNKTLTDFVKTFIEYDIKITKMGIQKGLKTERRPPNVRGAQERFYV